MKDCGSDLDTLSYGLKNNILKILLLLLPHLMIRVLPTVQLALVIKDSYHKKIKIESVKLNSISNIPNEQPSLSFKNNNSEKSQFLKRSIRIFKYNCELW